jgi:hypothetical protein
MALDEVTQICPVPVPSWLADSGGKGIQILTVAHGEAQLRSRWGDGFRCYPAAIPRGQAALVPVRADEGAARSRAAETERKGKGDKARRLSC